MGLRWDKADNRRTDRTKFDPVQGSYRRLMDGHLRAQVSLSYPDLTPLQLSQLTQREGRLLMSSVSEDTS